MPGHGRCWTSQLSFASRDSGLSGLPSGVSLCPRGGFARVGRTADVCLSLRTLFARPTFNR